MKNENGKKLQGTADRLEATIQKIVNSADTSEIQATYAEWAEHYDEDLLNYGYKAPELGAAIFASSKNSLNRTSGLVLDAGCGTGLVGAELNKLGFEHLHGVDFSSQMLEQAKGLGCYEQLLTADFSEPLPYATSTYDGLISIGVYKSTFGALYLSEMARVCKAGATIVFTARPQYFEDACSGLDTLVKKNLIQPYKYELLDYITGQESKAYFLTVVRLESHGS